MSPAARAADRSPWAPLRRPVFRSIMVADTISFMGTWVHQVAAAWLMTELAPSPLMVALVQAATGLSMFLVILPAGVLADVLDRRRVLLGAEVWMLAVAGVLGVLTLGGWTTPWVLLGLTLLLGFGDALAEPAWTAVIPELVPREELPAAIVLGGLGVNIAQAVGPALGGVIVAGAGAGAAFLLNAVSFLGLVVVVARWRRPHEASELPAERLASAMRTGMRYVRHTPQMVSVLVRLGLFIVAGSALWALLPLIARTRMGLSAAGYGLVVTCFGAGAVGAAVARRRLRVHLSVDLLVTASTGLYAAALAGLGLASRLPVFLAAAAVAGAAWLLLLSTYNTAAQTVLPSWVRARGMSVYVLVFFAGMTVGSVLWGAVAEHAGLTAAMVAAGVATAAGAALRARFRIEETEELDLSPTRHWPAPVVAVPIGPEEGPVLVSVEYDVLAGRERAFERAMADVGRRRRRSGAFFWDLFRDPSRAGGYLEVFLVESWAEHLRQHGRVTGLDREAEARAYACLREEGGPRMRHHLA
ncbi:MAG TPA: MFS transporter, partial [Gemmatimonadota bacterium]|nr:MFS transporter [Gemmatimonadota bacterium]